ncbi:MAG: DMT family transporter [Bdellovibrionales bacterium]|nr:DMT family transporter [Bdellovibrionales bacterium]
MLIVFASVLIFGLVHPASKLLLDQGIPLSYFCTLYVGIRFVIQLPFLFSRGTTNIKSRKIFRLLLLVGLVGALLQFFEFKGIHQGLPPATVTFLMFSYPIWILVINIFNRNRTVGAIEVAQSIAVVVGIFFLTQNEVTNFSFASSALVYPLLASIFIAAWIILSNRLRKDGVGTFDLSAYYDLLSVGALLAIFSGKLLQEWPQFLAWSEGINNISGMVAYSLLVGLLPNLMFYLGSRRVSSHFAGTVMGLEPLFSSIYSAIIWKSAFGSHFVIGGVLILLANVPKEFLASTFRRELVYEK